MHTIFMKIGPAILEELGYKHGDIYIIYTYIYIVFIYVNFFQGFYSYCKLQNTGQK